VTGLLEFRNLQILCFRPSASVQALAESALLVFFGRAAEPPDAGEQHDFFLWNVGGNLVTESAAFFWMRRIFFVSKIDLND
jgi:hypothetical protein